MIGKLDDAFRFHETALSMRAQRQQLLASNIANADTPNYKARDIDFSKALQGAVARGAKGTAPAGELARTSTTHLSSKGGVSSIGGAPVLYNNTRQGSVDGNTVDMDAQRNQFTDNALRYEAGITLMGAKIKGLMTAINGQ